MDARKKEDVMERWQTKERPGYLGKYREKKFAEWNARYGEGRWRLAWKVGQTFADYLGACALYEDAYFVFMSDNPEVTARLIIEASDIFDDAPTNVGSRFDYAMQETGRTHVQDIAIRRVLLRMGLWFTGPELIQIRHSVGSHPLSMTLSPGKVPFHRPDLMEPAPWTPESRPDHERWYDLDSTEAFYQFNKFLQVME